ncbi:hypothetical protein NG752_00580 [Aliarcobacter cryaerophilus]|uniref:hypothetical protein n=1 Tax=Aliarcobacter cryaerophilus TaxID=28198 RepID=UPI003DA44B7C
MSYEKFTELIKQNSQIEVIPTKTSFLAKGVVFTNDGYIQYKGETYKTDTVKLEELPGKIRDLFIVQKMPVIAVEDNNKLASINANNIEVKPKTNEHFDSLNEILFEQLQNIANPKADTDLNQEIKKANTICNIADKMIGIADLTLKAEMLSYKKSSN